MALARKGTKKMVVEIQCSPFEHFFNSGYLRMLTTAARILAMMVATAS